MKKIVKKNKRQKAVFGVDDAIMLGIGILSTAATIGTNIHNTNTQKELAEAQQKRQTLAGNEASSQAFIANQSENVRYNQNEELATARTGSLRTLNSAFKCGGKKRMKSGGTVVDNVKKTSRYI